MEKLNLLINEINRGSWAIMPEAANGYLPIVQALLKGDLREAHNLMAAAPNSDKALLSMPYAIHNDQAFYSKKDDNGNTVSAYDSAPAGSVSVISLQGPVMKNDYCGSAGTATKAKQIQEADAHPNIAAHILYVDSPGGSVDGTANFSQTIAGLTKPVVTYVDGLIASAGYWIGSSAKEIILSSATDIVGSIGTMVTIRDYAKAEEKYGVTTHEVYASDSVDKNKSTKDVKEGNYETLRSQTLNPLNDQFLSAVKTNRAGKINQEIENPLTGKTYVGQQAIDAGLADSMGSFQYAVSRALHFAGNQQVIHETNNTMKIKFLAAFAALTSFFGFSAAADATHVEGDITSEKWEELNTKLQQHDTLKAELDKAKADLTASQSKVSEMQGIINGQTTNVTTTKDDELGKTAQSLSIKAPVFGEGYSTNY